MGSNLIKLLDVVSFSQHYRQFISKLHLKLPKMSDVKDTITYRPLNPSAVITDNTLAHYRAAQTPSLMFECVIVPSENEYQAVSKNSTRGIPPLEVSGFQETAEYYCVIIGSFRPMIQEIILKIDFVNDYVTLVISIPESWLNSKTRSPTLAVYVKQTQS